MAELNTLALLSDTNLEGYYRGESGLLTTDSSGNTRTLTNNGTVISSTGKYGNAFDFGASNTTKYMSTTNTMNIDGGNISLSIWVKLTTTPASGVYACMIAQQNTSTNVNYQINYYNNGGTPEISFWRVRQGVSVDGGSYVHTLSTTEWTHLVLTYDGTNIRGYLNDSLVFGPTASSGNGSGAGSGGFTIGSDTNTASKFSGLIDDVAIFSKNLNTTEINDLYRNGTSINNFSSKANILNIESKSISVKANLLNSLSYSFSSLTNITSPRGVYATANISGKFGKKRYYYRVYDGNTFVASWANEVLTQPSFRNIINGGSSEYTIQLDRSFDDFGEDVDVKLNNKVEVWVSDREQPSGVLEYSGYISGYQPTLQGSKQVLEITVMNYIAETQRYLLRDGSGDTTVTYSSQDPSNIFKDIVDKFRADGGQLSYTNSSIDLTGTSVSYTFNTSTVKEALDKTIELCPVGWYWYISPDNILYLKPKSETADHTFTIKKNIVNMATFRRIEGLVNRVYFTGGGDPQLYRIYENSGSISTYGLYATKLVDSRVTDINTAEIIANRVIDTKKDPEIRTKIRVADSNGQFSEFGYDIESINVGDTMIIKGLREDTKTVSYWDQITWDVDVWDQTLSSSAADVIQIQSITYNPNYVDIEASSRLPEVPKRIEDINRNLVDFQTSNNPIGPS